MKTIVTALLIFAILPFSAVLAESFEMSFLGLSVAHARDENPNKLSNPLKGTNGEINDVGALFDDILSNIIIPLTLAVGVLFIVFAGLKFVLATGKPEAIGKAKQNLLYTVIGVAVVLSAQIILDILLSTLKEIGNVG